MCNHGCRSMVTSIWSHPSNKNIDKTFPLCSEVTAAGSTGRTGTGDSTPIGLNAVFRCHSQRLLLVPVQFFQKETTKKACRVTVLHIKMAATLSSRALELTITLQALSLYPLVPVQSLRAEQKPNKMACIELFKQNLMLRTFDQRMFKIFHFPLCHTPKQDLNFIRGRRICSRLCDDALFAIGSSTFCKLRRALEPTSYQYARLRKVRQDWQDHKSEVRSSVSLCSLAAWGPS